MLIMIQTLVSISSCNGIQIKTRKNNKELAAVCRLCNGNTVYVVPFRLNPFYPDAQARKFGLLEHGCDIIYLLTAALLFSSRI